MFPSDRISELEQDVLEKRQALERAGQELLGKVKEDFRPLNLIRRHKVLFLSGLAALGASLSFFRRSKAPAAPKRIDVPSSGGWVKQSLASAAFVAVQALAPFVMRGLKLALTSLTSPEHKHRKKKV